MREGTAWDVIRHRVSICGRISHPSGNPVGGAEILANPAGVRAPESESISGSHRRSGKARVEQPVVSMQTRRTESRPDGTFFFLDCPDGLYTVSAVEPLSGKQAQAKVPVAVSGMKKKAKDRGPSDGYYVELVMNEV